MLGSKVEVDESSTEGFSCPWMTVAYARDETEERHLRVGEDPLKRIEVEA